MIRRLRAELSSMMLYCWPAMLPAMCILMLFLSCNIPSLPLPTAEQRKASNVKLVEEVRRLRSLDVVAKAGPVYGSSETPVVYYCDPINGATPKNAADTTKGDGSAEKPWGTFESIVAAKLINGADATKGKVHAGDTIKLRTGLHGTFLMTGPEYSNTDTITIESDGSHQPVFTRVVSGGPVRNWAFRNLAFQSKPKVGKYQMVFRITGADIEVDNCKFTSCYAGEDWSDAQWVENCPWFGLHLTGTNIRVTNNYFYALENPLYVEGDGILVHQNKMEHFLNDGIEHAASNLTISENHVANQYNLKENAYHHDGIQGWTVGGKTNVNVTIKDNFVAYSTGKFADIPTLGSSKGADVFQGIVNFSGHWENLVVENNIVMAAGYHGISLYGCVNSAMRNNTVIDQGVNGLWVGFFRSGDFAGERDNLCERNIVPRINSLDCAVFRENFVFVPAHQPWVQKGYTLVKPQDTFVLYDRENAKFDLTVKDTSPAAGKETEVKEIIEVIKVVRTPAAGAVQQ